VPFLFWAFKFAFVQRKISFFPQPDCIRSSAHHSPPTREEARKERKVERRRQRRRRLRTMPALESQPLEHADQTVESELAMLVSEYLQFHHCTGAHEVSGFAWVANERARRGCLVCVCGCVRGTFALCKHLPPASLSSCELKFGLGEGAALKGGKRLLTRD
jgi:hypothetical protein